LIGDLDDVTAGIARWDRGGRLAYANRAFLDAFQLDGAVVGHLRFEAFVQLLASSNELVLALPPEDWVVAQVADFALDKDVEQLMADGRTLAVAQRRTTGGGMAVTVHDISGLKRIESDLRRAKKAAEVSGEAKSRFLRAANHDLRQPLATMKILIYNCMTEPDEEHRKDLFHAMDISVSIMEDLLGALLQIGQLDAGQIEARLTTFQLDQLFERLRIQFAHHAGDKGLTLRFVATREAVVSDKALLERILANLVANAVRYTEVGGILVGCRRRSNALRVEVWDTGRGIAQEHVSRIFEEFYQVNHHGRAKRPGLGLGLNIVKRLSDLLGHPVAVRSVPGRGSVFSITLPLGDIWHSELAEPEISEMIGGEFAGLSVLLVEDDDVLRRAVTELLERWGLRVTGVTSEGDALRHVADHGSRPNLIIADYSLRGQLGTHVVEAARARVGHAVPALIMTAEVDPAVLERIKAEGFPVLIKPVSPPRLRVMMHNLLFEPGALAAAMSRP
jgi:signal transduction histidine kinase/CheY-like chemotaxis protein